MVKATTGESVPGATVTYYEDSEGRYLREQMQRRFASSGRDREWLCRQIGASVIADQNGIAEVLIKDKVHIAGRYGGLYGEVSIGGTAKPGVPNTHVLRLERDLTFRVRVIDAAGSPAPDVPLGIIPVGADGQPEHGNRVNPGRS